LQETGDLLTSPRYIKSTYKKVAIFVKEKQNRAPSK